MSKTKKKATKKLHFDFLASKQKRITLVIFALLFAGIGSYFVFKSFAETGEWYPVAVYQEDSAYDVNGLAGNSIADCKRRMAVCHHNGKAVADPTAVGGGVAWESDPVANNQNFTWFGPYQLESYRKEIPSLRKACFYMKGLTSSDGIYIDVMYTTSTGKQTVRTSAAGYLTSGNATSLYKELCLTYSVSEFDYDYSPETQTYSGLVEYRVKTTSGTVRVDQVFVYHWLPQPPTTCIKCPINGTNVTPGNPASEALSNFQEPHKQPGFVIPKNEP